MKKKSAKTSSSDQIQDVFIREVRVNYVPTTVEPFDIRSPEHVATFFRAVAVDNSREQFMAMYLDSSHSVACYSLISIGSANHAVVNAREVFQRAVLVGATAMVVAHNHPSNRLEPSEEDIAVTKRLQEAGEILGVRLLDHVIVGDVAYHSIRTSHSNLFR